MKKGKKKCNNYRNPGKTRGVNGNGTFQKGGGSTKGRK